MEPIKRISNKLNVRTELHEEEQRLIKRPMENKKDEPKHPKKKKEEDNDHTDESGKGDYVDLDG